jgi:RNA polymerase sigma-70 factor (ECF subfamily)
VETDATRMVEQLIQDYGKLVFHIIFGLTGNWEDSQDLTQETFLQAFRKIDAARAASGPHFQAKAWLLQIAVNETRMAWRRRTLRSQPFSTLHPTDAETEDSSETPEALRSENDPGVLIAERDLVQRCLSSLPELYRLPLLLSIVAGFSSQEIARTLDLKEATVRQRLARARKAFQVRYARESGEQLSGLEHTALPAYPSRSADHLGYGVAAPAGAF